MVVRNGIILKSIVCLWYSKNAIIKGLLVICYWVLFSEAVFSQSSVESLRTMLRDQIQDTTRVRILNELGLKYTYSSTDSALFYAQQALSISERINYSPGGAKAHYVLTPIYRLLGNYPEALKSGLESLQYYRSVQDSTQLACSLNNLGSIFFRMEDYDKALSYYQQSLTIWKDLEIELSQAVQFVNIGNVYKLRNELDKALEYYHQALAINRRISPKLQTSINLENIGSLYVNQGEYDLALPYLFESLEISKEINDQQGIASITRYIAEVYHQTDQAQKSLEYAKLSLEVAATNKLKIEAAEASLILSDTYSKARDYQKALKFFRLHTTYNDSIYNTTRLRELSSLENNYEMRQKEQELKIQEQTIALLNQDSKIDRLWRNIMAGGLLIIGLLGFLVYKFQRLRNRKNAQLLANQQIVTQKLRELDMTKSRFFANISHEFRTPLTLITVPLKELYDGKYKGNPKKLYGLMLRSGKRLLGLINQLLDLSKIESGMMLLKPAKFELVSFLKPVLASYESLSESRLIHFKIKTPSDPVWLYFDAEKLEKIVHNLVSNAFKFTEEGGMVSVELVVSEKEEVVHIIIRDTGKGIPRDQLDHVFNRFYQVDNSQTRENEGTGIGLALTKELVELHQGKITVESKVNEGSSFSIILPMGKAHLSASEIRERGPYEYQLSQEEVISETLGVTSTQDMNRALEILIVEDNSDMRQFLRHTLEPHYQIFEAADGMAGRDAAIEKLPDLIISDVMMPKMDGVEMCRKLKKDQRTSHIPVILLTAKVDKDSKLAGLEIGADDYLAKPFDTDELLILLKNRIEQRQKLRERFSKEITLQPKDITITSADEQFLQQALDIVNQYMGDFNFNVKRLREEMGVGRMQLQRKIKALTDQSPVEFIRVLRLKRAAQLIAQRKDNISQITYEVGFGNLSYFSKCFKEHFGLAPSDYASQNNAVKS